MPGRILILLSGITFVVLLGVGIVVPILPSYARDMGASATQVGIMFSSFSLARIACNPLVGFLADRSELKRLMLVGLFLYSFIALLYVFADAPSQLITIRLFQGAASAFILPMAMSYVALIARKGEEGLFMGTFNMSLFLGMGAGPLLGGLITEHFGTRASFCSLSLLALISAVTALMLLPPLRPKPQGRDSGRERGIARFTPMGGLLLFRTIVALGSGCLMSFLPLLGLARGISIAQVGFLISVNVFVSGILQRWFGTLVSDRNRYFLIVAGSLISALALTSLPLHHDFLLFLLVSVLMGLGSAMSLPAASVMAMEHGRTVGMASAMSVFEASRDVGMVLGPLLAGAVMDTLSIDMVFYVGGMVSLAGTAVFTVLERKRPS
ncbi:MAG: MFS transporter [Desulfobacterota bacterium]|jgi:MFS family permease|nr:MFS transporter [Thermodesulfobacteriota bacterium]